MAPTDLAETVEDTSSFPAEEPAPGPAAGTIGAAATPTSWHHFERLVAAVRLKMEPNADVQWNRNLPGTSSGVPRQIDVVIRGCLLDGAPAVVDCKYLKVKADVKDVETVHGLFDDVGASKRILVTSKGFTPAALKRAVSLNIETCVLRPASDEDWEGILRSVSISYSLVGRTYDECEILTVNETWIPIDLMDSVADKNGDEALVEHLLNGFFQNAKITAGDVVVFTVTPAAHLLLDDANVAFFKIRCRPRQTVYEGFVEVEVEEKEDWVFVRYLPEEVVDEKLFFEFRDLDALSTEFAGKGSTKL